MPYVKTVATSAGQENFEAIAAVQSGPFPSDELGGSVAQRFTPSIPLKPSDQPWYAFERIAPSGPITLITDPTKLAAAQAAVEAIEGGAPPTGPIEVVHTATGLSVFADTLAEALALSDPDDIWRIAPGTYTGGITINVPGIIIEPKVGTARVRITPPSNAQNALQITATGIVLRSLEFDVPTAAHAVYVAGATATAALDGCFFYGDSVGPSTGSAVRVDLGRCDAGACRYMGGVSGAFLDVSGATAWLNAQGCSINTGSLTHGLREQGGAEVFAARLDIANGPGAPVVAEGLSLGAGRGRIVGSFLVGCGIGARLTADGGDWSIQNTSFIDCALDASVDVALSGVGTTLSAEYCELSLAKLFATPVWFSNAAYSANILDSLESEPTSRIIGRELSGGTALVPIESSFGGGNSYTVGMSVLRNTNGTAGTWSDITTDVNQGIGPGVRLLSSTAAGAAVYFGGLAPHPGIKIGFLDVGGGSAGDALVFAGPGINAIFEVWDGAAWTQVEMMSAESGGRHESYGQVVAGQIGSEQVRLGLTPDASALFTAGWFDMAPLSLNGSPPLYWSRIRLLAGITTSPESNAIKIHTSRTKINAPGDIEHFGDARRLFEVFQGWHRNLLDDAPGSPGNERIPVSPSITLTPTDNEFANGADDFVSGGFIWPDNADSSYPLRLQMFFFQSSGGSGNAHIRVAIAKRRAGQLFNGGAPELVRTFNAGDLGAIPVPGVDQEKFDVVEVDLPLNGVIGGVLPGDEVFISFGRPDSSNPDSFNGNIAYSNTRLLMTFYK